MRFDEAQEGEYRIYAGALEGPRGDGYIAALVVQREHSGAGTRREAFRDESLACGHRWASAEQALAYAISHARTMVRQRPQMLAC